MSERHKVAANNAILRLFQVRILVFLLVFSYAVCENGAFDGSGTKSSLSKDTASESASTVGQSKIPDLRSEVTILSVSGDASHSNAYELSVQEQCNQLWSYRNKLKHQVSNVVKSHREFVMFLSKSASSLNDANSMEEIFKRSLNISLNDRRSKKISSKFKEFHGLAKDYQFISSDKDESETKILISSRSPLSQTLKDLFILRNEYSKYANNLDLCIKKRKKVVKNGQDSLNAIKFLSKSLNTFEGMADNENIEYFSKLCTKPGNADSDFGFVKTLIKLQEVCDKGINQENPLARKKQIKWLKKKSGYISKTMDSFEAIVESNLKKINNMLNCINHFQNSNSINENTLGMVDRIGGLIVSYSTNRINILSVISSRYTMTAFNAYILNNRPFSLWLFIQKRLTAVQVAIKLIKESKDLMGRMNSVISMERSIELLTKCSETLRKTASDWSIFSSDKHSVIINSLHKDALKQLNHYRFEGNPSTLTMSMEWVWLNNNVEDMVNKGYDVFEEMIKSNLQTPLKSCAKSLSSLYKSLKSEFKVDRKFSEKTIKKVNKEYRSVLNDVSDQLMKQADSLSSLKHSFLWPHNNATLISALSMYNRTLEFVSSLNLPQDQQDFEKPSYSHELLKQQKTITHGFSILYENVKTRFNWDFNFFLNEFGYLRNIDLGIETEETIDFSKLKIFQDQSSQFGEWFETTLEFLSLTGDSPSKVKNIIEPAIQFRLQFIQQWSDIISKFINRVGNPTALSVSKISEEAYNYYMQYQVSKSKELSSDFESNISILKYVEAVDNALSDLNKESFISKFETINAPVLSDSSYHGDDEFPSVLSIKNYLLELKSRVDSHCSAELKRNDEEYTAIVQRICDRLPLIFSTINQNLKRIESKMQKTYSDLDSQRADIEKLDAIIQDCISMDSKVARVKCWIPNQSIELPLRRALQIRRVMSSWLRDVAKTKILLFSNFVEGCLKLNIKGSLIFESSNEASKNKDQQGKTEMIKSFQLLLKMINDLMPNIVDEMKTLETMYSKFYENKINQVTSASKTLIYDFVRLKSIKTTLIHYYGKPNIFQRIFRFPKLLLSKEEVYDLESSTFAYETPVHNNVTYAADLADYIKNNQISSRNHTMFLSKYLKALSTLKNRIQDIPQVTSENSTFSGSNLEADIEFERFKSIEERSLLILGESDKYLKLANIENFRYYTVRNITSNVTDVITNLSDEIKRRGEELERKEEEIASTNCFRRWRWKRRVKRRKMKEIKDEKIDKVLKRSKHNAASDSLKLKKKEANGKLKLFLTKTICVDNLDKTSRAADDYENITVDYQSDLESFQFDDLYKFDERPARFNPKNQVRGEVDYDVDTGGRTEDGKKTNPLILKISNAVDMAVTINNSIRQYKEIKSALKQSGIEFSQENSGVNLMAGLDVITALTGGPTDDLSAILGSINDQDQVFNEADILGELQTGDTSHRVNSVNKQVLENNFDISYDDFKRKVELELKNSDLNFDLDD